MSKYSEERKEAVLRKMLPPHNRPLKELAAEEGISEATLYNWRRQARAQGRLLPDADAGPAKQEKTRSIGTNSPSNGSNILA